MPLVADTNLPQENIVRRRSSVGPQILERRMKGISSRQEFCTGFWTKSSEHSTIVTDYSAYVIPLRMTSSKSEWGQIGSAPFIGTLLLLRPSVGKFPLVWPITFAWNRSQKSEPTCSKFGPIFQSCIHLFTMAAASLVLVDNIAENSVENQSIINLFRELLLLWATVATVGTQLEASASIHSGIFPSFSKIPFTSAKGPVTGHICTPWAQGKQNGRSRPAWLWTNQSMRLPKLTPTKLEECGHLVLVVIFSWQTECPTHDPPQWQLPSTVGLKVSSSTFFDVPEEPLLLYPESGKENKFSESQGVLYRVYISPAPTPQSDDLTPCQVHFVPTLLLGPRSWTRLP